MADEYDKAHSAIYAAKLGALDDGKVLLGEMIDLVAHYVFQDQTFAIARVINYGAISASDARRLVAGDALVKLMGFIARNEEAITAVAKRGKGNE